MSYMIGVLAVSTNHNREDNTFPSFLKERTFVVFSLRQHRYVADLTVPQRARNAKMRKCAVVPLLLRTISTRHSIETGVTVFEFSRTYTNTLFSGEGNSPFPWGTKYLAGGEDFSRWRKLPNETGTDDQACFPRQATSIAMRFCMKKFLKNADDRFLQAEAL